MQFRSDERRRDARLAMNRPVKVECEHAGRYVTGYTQNLSTTGALMDIDHPSLMVPGQRVKVGVAYTRRSVIIKKEEMIPGTVVRSAGLGNTQTIAIQFDERQELALSA